MSEFSIVCAGVGARPDSRWLGAQGGMHRIPAQLTAADTLRERGVETVVTAVVDPVEGRARAYIDQYRDPAWLRWLASRGYPISRDTLERFLASAEPYTRIEEALDRGADAVVSVVPGAAKMEVGLAAAEAGCHLYTDKPTAPTPEEAERLYAAFVAADRFMKVGYHLEDMIGRVVDFLERERLVIRWWRITWYRADGVPGPRHFTDPRSGGVTRDIGSHLVPPINPLTGQWPTSVLEATASYAAGPDRAETGMCAKLALPDGGRVDLGVDWRTGFGAGEQLRLEGWGDDGEELTARLHANRTDEDRPNARAFVPVLRREDDPTRPPLAVGEAPPLYTETMVKGAVGFVLASVNGEPADRSGVVVEQTVAAMLSAANTGRETRIG